MVESEPRTPPYNAKGKVVPVHNLKLYRDIRDTDPLTFSLSSRLRLVISLTFRPLYLQPIDLGGAQSWSGR